MALSYGAWYNPTTQQFANSRPGDDQYFTIDVPDEGLSYFQRMPWGDDRRLYGGEFWDNGGLQDWLQWKKTPFPDDPLTSAIYRGADAANFQSPYRDSVLQMMRAYAPIMGQSENTNWRDLFYNVQEQQFRKYRSWSDYDNPSQTFVKLIEWGGLPNAAQVKSYVESTPEFKREAEAFSSAWNASNQSSGSFFDDILPVASIAVAFMFPQLAGFIGEAMGVGAATSTAAMVAGNAVMQGGIAAIQGKSPEEILEQAAIGGFGGAAQSLAVGGNSFLQSLMDAGVPWDVVQAIPKAGVSSLGGALTSALQGNDPLSGMVTGGAFSLLGGSISNALTANGVAPLAANAAAQGINQLIVNGDISPEALASSAALGTVNPYVSKILQDAGVPTAAIPTAIKAVNQVLTTGDINPESLALAATGQFVSAGARDLKNELAGGLPGAVQGETTPIPAQDAITSTPLSPEVVPQVPAEGALTQLASNATRTDVPIGELMPGDPGYVYTDGTVEPKASSGLGSVTTTPIAPPEAIPSEPSLPPDQTLLDQYYNQQTVTPEITTIGGLPSDIDQQISQTLTDQEAESGNTPAPDPTNADVSGNVGYLPSTSGGLPTTATPTATPTARPTSTGVPYVGGLPTDPNAAMNNMNKTLGLDSSQNFGDPSRRAYLSPAVLSTQGGGKATPTYAQLIPQLASVLNQRGYAGGGQVDIDAHFADILSRRGYPVEMVPGPEDRLYRRHMKRGFAVNGPGTGQSDDIPTMLADGEYVIDADTVAQLGDGSSKAGAQVLDRFREEIRKHKRSAPVDKIPPKAKSPLEYLKAAQKGKKNG